MVGPTVHRTRDCVISMMSSVERVAFRRLAPFHTEAYAGCALNRLGAGERGVDGFVTRVFSAPGARYLPFAGLDPLCIGSGAELRLAWQPRDAMIDARVLAEGGGPVAGYAVLGTGEGGEYKVAVDVGAAADAVVAAAEARAPSGGGRGGAKFVAMRALMGRLSPSDAAECGLGRSMLVWCALAPFGTSWYTPTNMDTSSHPLGSSRAWCTRLQLVGVRNCNHIAPAARRHEKAVFCGKCGAATRVELGGMKRVCGRAECGLTVCHAACTHAQCPDCPPLITRVCAVCVCVGVSCVVDGQSYPRTDPVVIVAVGGSGERDGQLLLARQVCCCSCARQHTTVACLN